MRRRWAAAYAAGMLAAALTIGWGAAAALSAARDAALGVVDVAALAAGGQYGGQEGSAGPVLTAESQPGGRQIFCRRGWHRVGERCVRNRPGGPVLASAGCPATSECPPVCQRVKFTNSAGTAWVTALLCDMPHKGPVVCTASGQATSRPEPGSVYLCRRG